MDKPDLLKMQEEYLKGVSDFSARYASLWAEALKGAGVQPSRESAPSPTEAKWDPSSFLRVIGASTAAVDTLQRAMKLAAEDLPEVMKGAQDPRKLDRIKEKWVKFHEKSLREALGVPEPSEGERLLEQWRAALETLQSGAPPTPDRTAQTFMGLMSPTGWPLPGMRDPRSELFRPWLDAYGGNLGKILAAPALALAADRDEGPRKALEAQLRFLGVMPEFQGHFADGARRAVEEVLKNLAGSGLQGVGSESLDLFRRMWMDTGLRIFQELFSSEAFLNTLAKALKQGLEARTMMENAFLDRSAVKRPAEDREMEDLRRDLYAMEKRVRLLERELEDIKRELEKKPG